MIVSASGVVYVCGGRVGGVSVEIYVKGIVLFLGFSLVGMGSVVMVG